MTTDTDTASLTFTAFSISNTTCTGALFTYKITQSDGTNLPNTITLDQTTRTINWGTSTTSADAGNYTVRITGTLNNGQSAYTDFFLNLNYGCNNATAAVVSPALTDQTYVIGSGY